MPTTVYAPPQAVDLSAVWTERDDFARTDAALVGDAVEHYGRLARGVPAVAFYASIEHSRMVAARFNAAGFRAAHIDGTTEWPSKKAASRCTSMGCSRRWGLRAT